MASARSISGAPRPEALLRIIKRLTKEDRISYLAHAIERMQQRGFDIFDVKQVLAHGYIDGSIRAGARDGEWTVKLVDELEGTSRKMGVVTIVVREDRLLIKTTEWEDL
jgi:predicted amino acid-binding ACT domain protein